MDYLLPPVEKRRPVPLPDAPFKGGLVIGTNMVHYDEPAYSLKEFNWMPKDSKGIRRYQMIRVVRNDRIVEMVRDLGPSGSFTATEFMIPGGLTNENGKIEILETVGSLIDIADDLRGTGAKRQPVRARPNLIDEYREQPERRRKWRKRQSSFGSLARVQRG